MIESNVQIHILYCNHSEYTSKIDREFETHEKNDENETALNVEDHMEH